MLNFIKDREYPRQLVKGIFFCRQSADEASCRQLLQDLGCRILTQQDQHLTIEANRARLQHLKRFHQAGEDDRAQIGSRLQAHFERILIGGTSRA